MLNYSVIIVSLADNSSNIDIHCKKIMKVTCHVLTFYFETITSDRQACPVKGYGAQDPLAFGPDYS